MVRIETCYFCSSPVYPGHGINFVRNDSKIFRFCRSKCHRNFKKKRNPRKLRWTKAYRQAHNKELQKDSTFEFEKRRNRPVRYDRELVGRTLNAIKTVGQVRKAREQRFFENRMRVAKTKQKAYVRAEIKKGVDILPPSRIPESVRERLRVREQERASQEEEKLKVRMNQEEN